ncbi:MAG: enoyl-CoA hydratase-related protein [Burkholderiaceae bacterium]
MHDSEASADDLGDSVDDLERGAKGRAAAAVGLKVQRRDGVVTLTLNRPERSNSLSGELIAALCRELDALERDPNNRVVVLTGAGERSFCGGADLKSAGTLKFDPNTTSAPYADLLRSFRRLQLPLVARVNGSAAAGGVGLFGVCDFAIAVSQARFSISEIDIGFFPSMVVAALHRSMPRFKLNAMCMLGRKMSADEAVEAGLLSAVVAPAELDAAVDELVRQLLGKPTAALRRGKYMLRAIESMPFGESLAFTETMLRLQSNEPSALEGLAAFREKRPPVWP